MSKNLKTIALAAAAFAAMSIPFATAQAQSGYDYLFWRSSLLGRRPDPFLPRARLP